MKASETFPNLYDQFLSSWEKASNGRVMLIALAAAVLFVLLMAVKDPAQSTIYTAALIALAAWGIWQSQQHLKHVRNPETSFEKLTESLRAMAIGPELAMLDKELADKTEWSVIIMTDHYLLWKGQVQDGRITSIANILLLDYTFSTSRSGTYHHLSVQTKYTGKHDIATGLNEIPEEFFDIYRELIGRNPKIVLSKSAHKLFTPEQPHHPSPLEEHHPMSRDLYLDQLADEEAAEK